MRWRTDRTGTTTMSSTKKSEQDKDGATRWNKSYVRIRSVFIFERQRRHQAPASMACVGACVSSHFRFIHDVLNRIENKMKKNETNKCAIGSGKARKGDRKNNDRLWNDFILYFLFFCAKSVFRTNRFEPIGFEQNTTIKWIRLHSWGKSFLFFWSTTNHRSYGTVKAMKRRKRW